MVANDRRENDSASRSHPLSDERPSQSHDAGTCGNTTVDVTTLFWILRSPPNCDMGLALL
jgi:hypothetical protein